MLLPFVFMRTSGPVPCERLKNPGKNKWITVSDNTIT